MYQIDIPVCKTEHFEIIKRSFADYSTIYIVNILENGKAVRWNKFHSGYDACMFCKDLMTPKVGYQLYR